MKKLLAVTGFTLGMAFTAASYASDARVEHFKGHASPDLSTAVANLAEYNKQLQVMVDSALSDEDMAEIHMLTYTLENALERINLELEEIAEALEEVHLASETLDRERLTGNAAIYLDKTAILLGDN